MNDRLELYSAAIKSVAAKHGLYFADTYKLIAKDFEWHESEIKRLGIKAAPLSDNGMHLTEDGYQRTATEFAESLGVQRGGENNHTWNELDALRRTVVAKNQLFFHRWRPENETYLFGFRKHEQGKNAKEVAEFDPLVGKAEEEIAKQLKELKK
jgi:hypothetical protein